MSMTRALFFSYEPTPQCELFRPYGQVPGFSIAKLPDVLQERVSAEMRPFRGRPRRTTVRELVRIKQQRGRVAHLKGLSKLQLAPDSSAATAVRDILSLYFRELDRGKREKDACLLARQHWLLAFRNPCVERTIRRIAQRVDAFGGPEIAPLDAYHHAESIPHGAGKRGQQNTTGAARPAASLLPFPKVESPARSKAKTRRAFAA